MLGNPALLHRLSYGDTSSLWAAHLSDDEGMMKKPELILALTIIGMKKKHDFFNNPIGDFGSSPFHNLQIMAVLMLQSSDYSFHLWNFASVILCVT